MTAKEPYLIRAFYQWIVDNDCTPYLVVDSRQHNVMVPETFIQSNGQITLNVSPGATGNLELGDEAITFNARFGGVPHNLYIPCYAVLAIFAKETGEGTGFAPIEPTATEVAKPKAVLSSVATVSPLTAVDDIAKPGSGKDDKAGEDGKPKKKGSHLSVVK